VIDITLNRRVINYQAQVLIDASGKRFVAPFPKEVTKAAQYEKALKAHAVYLFQHQLIPYARVCEYFSDQVHLPMSEGPLYNFTVEAYQQLEAFEDLSKQALAQAAVNHADETGINIGGKRHWLHCASNIQWVVGYTCCLT
jgi:transposase